ncbi:MAG: ABC transporter permease [Candidatus Saccharibacteria bacterium]|nr:ABC transporter permease [Candidatus Saccharibacteria bacterium]
MKTFIYLVRRHTKLYFKDKATFFTSLITPMILLVLYATFLQKVYRDSIAQNFPAELGLSDNLIDGVVNAQLVSSLLAVSCVTVAFCVNLIMVKDRADEVRKDMTVSPVKTSTLALSYFFASLLSTLIVCYATLGVCFAYIAATDTWFFNGGEVAAIIGGVFMLALFGTSLASLVNCRLKTNGQASAIGSMVSSMYGFICGAYMPLSNFSEGLRNIIGCLPSTYGTSIIRNLCFSGVLREMEAQNIPSELTKNLKDALDCNLYLYGNQVEFGWMFVIMVVSIVVLIGAYVLLNVVKIGSRRKLA